MVDSSRPSELAHDRRYLIRPFWAIAPAQSPAITLSCRRRLGARSQERLSTSNWCLGPTRLIRSAIVLRPSTILGFHRALVKRKYRMLFTPKRRGKPGPKGPAPELIAAIVEMKRRNPRFGCPRIAQQVSFTFGVDIDKDVVRRVLAKHYRPEPSAHGPSWLTFLGVRFLSQS